MSELFMPRGSMTTVFFRLANFGDEFVGWWAVQGLNL
jgi:hypothetical protein